MIELYLAGTANGLRAAVALEECGLQYRPHAVDLAKNEQRNPEFLKINPAGLIPALVDPEGPGGKPLTLSQSGAIVLYAAEKSGRFLFARCSTACDRAPVVHAGRQRHLRSKQRGLHARE